MSDPVTDGSVHDPRPPVEDAARHDDSLARARRRFLRAGAGATPVLLTVLSNPVSATGSSCVKASGFISAATFKSRNPTATSNTLQCTTFGLNGWKYEAQNFSASAYKNELNKTVGVYLGERVGSGNVPASPHNATQLKDFFLLAPAGSDAASVLQRIVAMCLDLQYKGAPMAGDFNYGYLVGVWADVAADGRYNPPGSGVNWSVAETATWLDRLMTSTLPL